MAERFCPDGANADEPHLADSWLGDVGLREREDGVKGAAAVDVGCPAGQGQTRARRVWWSAGWEASDFFWESEVEGTPSGQATAGVAWRLDD